LKDESFERFALTLDQVGQTSSKLEKVRFLAEYFSTLSPAALASACRFILGKESDKGDVGVGWSTTMRAIRELRGIRGDEMRRLYLEFGDVGSSVEKIFSSKIQIQLGKPEPLTITDVQQVFDKMAESTGPGSSEVKKKFLVGLYARMDGKQAKYLTRILNGELRIGATEGIVLDALGKAFNNEEVRNWYLIVGDVGALAAKLSRRDTSPPEPDYFRPVAFMLALPLQDSAEVAKHFGKPVFAEYKYDGVRLQAHVKDGQVHLYSRRMEDVTRSMPDVTASLSAAKVNMILDGEALAFDEGKPISFMMLQRRLHRKNLSQDVLRAIPVHYFVFDLLKLGDSSLLGSSLSQRKNRMKSLNLEGNVRMAYHWTVASPEEIEKLFRRSRDEGYEGLVLKDPISAYTPGRRGGSWAKLKEELDTLDVVVVGAEYGNGKRAGLLSDLTFAVWDDDELKTIGKAYSGLTDDEIKNMTELLQRIKIRETWNGVIVPPSIVLEVAFDSIQKSTRHESGFALRFPRIKRVRDDKKPEDADTVERVRQIFGHQFSNR